MLKVLVLCGGVSRERDISLSSGDAVAKALTELGYTVYKNDIGHSLADLYAALSIKADVVFNALHGGIGENGVLSGLLEHLGICYTHSDMTCSAIAMNKKVSNTLFTAAGLCVPKSKMITPQELAQKDPMDFPYVIKPIAEGSSFGVEIFLKGNNQRQFIAENWQYGSEIMVQEFVPGRELTVAVLDNKPLAVTEIVYDQPFYDYTAKYIQGESRHVIPASIPKNIYDKALTHALLAHEALGCKGISRSDFRFDATADSAVNLKILEVNNNPGLLPTSLLPEQAHYCGISYNQLCDKLVQSALQT